MEGINGIFLILLAACIFGYAFCQPQKAPKVTIACGGQLEGKIVATPRGICHAFFGVPFAAPPVGELRFEKPQPFACWTDVRKAKDFAPQCIQSNGDATNETLESEDCLYLNVIRPASTGKPKQLLPVMVFIHGGAYQFGSPHAFSQPGACANLAQRGVIYVSIAYRMNIYGFFSTGDATAPGNYGQWDVIAALKWIKENIASFGGDPNKVTVFGESAGAGSASLLSYIPQAKDLFQQSIMQSGSWFPTGGDQVVTPVGLEVLSSLAVVNAANCTSSNTSDILKCIRKLDTKTLQDAFHRGLADRNYQNLTYGAFNPRVDGELLNGTVPREISKKPTIVGVDSLEMLQPDPANIPRANGTLNVTLGYVFPGNSTESAILKQIAKYVYIDSKGDPSDPKFVVEQAAKIGVHSTFFIRAVREADSKAAFGSPIWFYYFDHYSENNFAKDFPFKKGAPHAHELCYLFLIPMTNTTNYLTCPRQYVDKHRQVADHIGTLWTNFAKTGNPSPKELKWPQYKSIYKANVMNIRPNLSILKDFFPHYMSFWNVLRPEIRGVFASKTG